MCLTELYRYLIDRGWNSRIILTEPTSFVPPSSRSVSMLFHLQRPSVQKRIGWFYGTTSVNRHGRTIIERNRHNTRSRAQTEIQYTYRAFEVSTRYSMQSKRTFSLGLDQFSITPFSWWELWKIVNVFGKLEFWLSDIIWS